MAQKLDTCHCKHDAQDKKYGKGVRLFNSCTPKNGSWRCTVCGKSKA